MIHFQEITEENFDAVIRMRRPEGEHFVAPNSVSLAQAWLYRADNDVFPFAIYNDDDLVGFLLLEECLDQGVLELWRIMFPPEHEHKGYGTAAVRRLIQEAKQSGKYRAICLDCAPDNHIARHVYEKLGFRPTGKINHGDPELSLPL